MEATLTAPVSMRARWIGRIASALPVLFLLGDGGAKLAGLQPVIEGSARLGIPAAVVPTIGLLELACLTLYVVPRTAVLGAVLMTGYLGGAVAIHLRIGDPLLSHTLFPVYFGALLWVGLALRDPRARALIAR